MNITGLQRTTILDYPGYVACIVFTSNCNLKCPFCHNSELIDKCNPIMSSEDFFEFLKMRKDKLDGVCISGGEPLLQEDIISFITEIKRLGFLVKLDTNGTVPDKLKELLDKHLVDYIAMDVKNCMEKYAITCGFYNLNTTNIKTSINLIMNSGIDYEFRTTLVKGFHESYDMIRIANLLKGCKNYYLQKFKMSDNVLDKKCSSLSNEEMQRYLEIVRSQIPNAKLRGVD